MLFPVYDENGLRCTEFRPWVTWIIVATNVLIAILLGLLPAEFFVALAYQFGLVPGFITGQAGSGSADLLVRPELTLLTYGFIHAKWSHLASNMLVLWVFGDNIEKATGHFRFLAFYFLCQIAGGLTHVVSDPASLAPSIGASSGVAGVVAGYLLVRPRARVVMLVLGVMTVNFPAYWVIAGWITWQLVEFLIERSSSNVAYWGHFGGFAMGLLLIVTLRRPGVKILEGWHPAAAWRTGLAMFRRALGRLRVRADALRSRKEK